MQIVAIDIGSTWTKGALFDYYASTMVFVKSATSKTTVDDLATGFYQVLQELAPDYKNQLASDELKLFYSSSAKGGLNMSVIGIVPEITLETAKITAYSAGAKVSHFFAYHLTNDDINKLEDSESDIILFTGGTDGGNTDYVLNNAKKLAKANINCSIVYAGNRSVVDEVTDILQGKELYIADNILPNMNSISPQSAREAIRAIFLEKIVKGKGIDKIANDIGQDPLPTPLAVYNLVQSIRTHVQDWQAFMLMDLGGATTDIYSSYQEEVEPGTVYRGLEEPKVKRTVEGDLGLRFSASTAADSAKTLLMDEFRKNDTNYESLSQYAQQVANNPQFIGESDQDRALDQLIVSSCITNAVSRHAGRMHQVHTTDGMVNVQTGRNLKSVNKVIGSGGFLAKATDYFPARCFNKIPIDGEGHQVLLPTDVAYYRDEKYLIPLLGSIAQAFPKAAAKAAVQYLVPQESKPTEIPVKMKIIH